MVIKLLNKDIHSKFYAFWELIIAILLDTILVILVWSLQTVLFKLIGTYPEEAIDKSFIFVLILSKYCVLIVYSVFLIIDSVQHILKAYYGLQEYFIKVFLSRNNH